MLLNLITVNTFRNTNLTYKDKEPETFSSVIHLKGELHNIKKYNADSFNQYFTKVGPNLAAKIKAPDNKAYKSYLEDPTNHVFQYVDVRF